MPFAICEARVMSWPQADPLDSDRLALEPLAVDHAAEMLTALAPPELYRFAGGEPPTLDELGARYRRQSRGQSLGRGLLPKARPPAVVDLGGDAGDAEPECDEDAETELSRQGPSPVGADQDREGDRHHSEDDGDGGEEDRGRAPGSTIPELDALWNARAVTVSTASADCEPAD